MGRRGANQTAVFFAALGTAACGFSTNMEMLIAARFVSYNPQTTLENVLTITLLTAWRYWRRWYYDNRNVRSCNFATMRKPYSNLSLRIITSDMYSLRVSPVLHLASTAWISDSRSLEA